MLVLNTIATNGLHVKVPAMDARLNEITYRCIIVARIQSKLSKYIKQLLSCEKLYLLNLDSLTPFLVSLDDDHLTVVLVYRQYFNIISLFLFIFNEHYQLAFSLYSAKDTDVNGALYQTLVIIIFIIIIAVLLLCLLVLLFLLFSALHDFLWRTLARFKLAIWPYRT